MDCFAIFLACAVLALWIVVAATKRLGGRYRQKQLLIQLQKWFAGKYHSGGLFLRPRLSLRYGQTEARVSVGSGVFPGSAFQVSIAWPYRVSCAVHDRTTVAGWELAQRLGPAVEVPGEFGRRFAVHSHDETETRGLLTPGVEWQLQRLLSLGPTPQLQVLIRGGTIEIHKPWRRPQAEAVAQWVQGCLELYDQCMLAKASGIEFLHSDEAQMLDQVICQICGDEIVEQMVVCRRCKTPHHAECWSYTGVCSVFGCRETVCEKPQGSH